MTVGEHRRNTARKTSRTNPTYAAPRLTMDELLASGAKLNRTSAEFLKTDLQTLLIFSKSALSADSAEKKTRNCQAARKGYDTILRLIGKVRLTEDDADYFSQNLQRLKSELQTLGEIV
jgi:hypothetical protein